MVGFEKRHTPVLYGFFYRIKKIGKHTEKSIISHPIQGEKMPAKIHSLHIIELLVTGFHK